jgi:hypothetical protein
MSSWHIVLKSCCIYIFRINFSDGNAINIAKFCVQGLLDHPVHSGVLAIMGSSFKPLEMFCSTSNLF